ncbi:MULTISPECIES: hypothetical protein [unclassified Streptomyces]|uniref:hypothetical protein n=1 Tax=unclassified Streptomyces TaxID=2593676 RepID=UPI00224F68B9|nr:MULTISPECIES: hypothetical protein [unclassified Streptomyces]MCX4878814.1 hypothetical protein [Streptomyces sp. NBC_00847]MCX5418778.1 hypothetical protein [Streptomyces sp. NBC_00078]
MRTFQRAAVVAAAVAGLSVLGVGVGFADDSDGPRQGTVMTFPVYSTPQADTKKDMSEEGPKYVLPEFDLGAFLPSFATAK